MSPVYSLTVHSQSRFDQMFYTLFIFKKLELVKDDAWTAHPTEAVNVFSCDFSPIFMR
jgi:hypothetical protein